MQGKDAVFQQVFIDPIHRNGRGTMLAAVICLFLPGLYLAMFQGLVPDPGTLLGALFAVWAIFVVIGLIEPVVYYPMLGFGGTYMSFLVGNVLNLRVPVAMTAQEVVGTRPGTPEAEVVSTLGIAGSLISSQLVLIVGMLAFLPFLDGLKGSGSSLVLALDQVLPALFGALGRRVHSQTPPAGRGSSGPGAGHRPDSGQYSLFGGDSPHGDPFGLERPLHVQAGVGAGRRNRIVRAGEMADLPVSGQPQIVWTTDSDCQKRGLLGPCRLGTALATGGRQGCTGGG